MASGTLKIKQNKSSNFCLQKIFKHKLLVKKLDNLKHEIYLEIITSINSYYGLYYAVPIYEYFQLKNTILKCEKLV